MTHPLAEKLRKRAKVLRGYGLRYGPKELRDAACELDRLSSENAALAERVRALEGVLRGPASNAAEDAGDVAFHRTSGTDAQYKIRAAVQAAHVITRNYANIATRPTGAEGA